MQCTDHEYLGRSGKDAYQGRNFPIRHAADCGAKLICFPEQFATGWDPQPHKNIQDIHGSIISSLQAYAKEYRIGILGSLREAHDPLPKNTAIAIGRDGRILTSYAKMHLFSFCHEHEANSPGTDLGIFTFDSLTCGIAICYDLRFLNSSAFMPKRAFMQFLFRQPGHKAASGTGSCSSWHGLQKTRCMFWE